MDIETVRAETPACEHVLHFNNAGASLMPLPVVAALQGVLDDEVALGGYEAERRAAADLTAFYDEFAALLNGRSEEIAYVENATRAWDMAFYGLELGPGDRVITHGSEYVSNYLALLQQAERRGFEIDVVGSDETGQIDVAALERAIRPETKLIAITHVPTQGGLVNPAEDVGRIARAHGVLYMLDACQSVGQIDVDVARIGCDILSGTGRKFLRGPRGTGFLWVRCEVVERIDPPFLDLRAANWTGPDSYEMAPGARRFETWESFVAGRVGLMAAVRYARGIGMAAIEARVETLGQQLREALDGLRGVSVHDRGARKCGIVTLRKEGIAPAEMAARLREEGINVSVSQVSSARLDLGPRGIDALLRASVHYFNTEAEVVRFAEAVDRL
ncbi:aminotransferase class V-fold PLP-dependent enzyme [Roseovarius sp. SCSIO 43702]|uniref:aminotransferase class V-fold PLP-dependent enzyme n=1 Tax=Roseovarius sp. SCSIO 43702 TaxID=2823043 RepID=UPI001C7338DB|nr:aminotransferase class V-fold PLP-dependent enzyme [Roseovarius sp. SCSIO 43702]QYX58419.1 aminotransferase class V-fold PLP-dependent enzyme [Roseovarius sp. SCSIO 43702]